MTNKEEEKNNKYIADDKEVMKTFENIFEALLKSEKERLENNLFKTFDFLNNTSFEKEDLLNLYTEDNLLKDTKIQNEFLLAVLYYNNAASKNDFSGFTLLESYISDLFCFHYKVDRKYNWLVIYYINGELKTFLSNYIKNKEGLSCSSDKSNFILSKILEHFITNENQELFQNYEEYKGSDWTKDWEDEKFSKQAYWSPVSLKNTDEAIDKFTKYLELKNELYDQLD